MDNYYIVDRIEGDFYVLEAPNEDIITVDKKRVDNDAKEGDCLKLSDNYFTLDKEASDKRRVEMANRMKGMWQ